MHCPPLSTRVFVTLVLPLPHRRLGGAPGAPAGLGRAACSLLQVAAAVPAVGVLAEPLARLVVDALCVSDGGPETRRRTCSCKGASLIQL